MLRFFISKPAALSFFTAVSAASWSAKTATTVSIFSIGVFLGEMSASAFGRVNSARDRRKRLIFILLRRVTLSGNAVSNSFTNDLYAAPVSAAKQEHQHNDNEDQFHRKFPFR